jgi:hypothetical protein
MLSFKVPLTYIDYCDKLRLNPKEESSGERYRIYHRRFQSNNTLIHDGEDECHNSIGKA